MKKAFSKTVNLGLIAAFSVISFSTVLPVRAAALDASFVPQASIVLTCIDENSTDKRITKFTNNAPDGSKVVLTEQDANGNFSTEELAVGDTVVNTPRLTWRIDGVYLGPWEVPTTIEGKCLTNESAFANEPPASITPYLIGAGAALLLVGIFLAGMKLSKKK